MELKNFLLRWRKSRILQSFPENFFFGVDTADHQCEAFREELPDVWDAWEAKQALTKRGRGTDFEQYFAEDIERARELGCKAFRFSISWSRVQTGLDEFQPDAFDHYQHVIDAIHQAGMKPVLTLMHFTWPLWVVNAGGLIADDFPKIFCNYVQAVVQRFGTQVPIWITINEPSLLVFGYIKTWWQAKYPMPPGWPAGTSLETQIHGAGKLMRNLFLAHTRARKIIRAANPHALVTANPLVMGLPPLLQRWLDYNASRIHTYEDFLHHGRNAAQRSLLALGTVDVVLAAVAQTLDREEQVLFSDVYFVAGQALLVQAESQSTGIEFLTGKSVAVVKGTTAAEQITLILPEVLPFISSDYSSALKALSSGQVAALLADDAILAGLIKTHPGHFRILLTQLSVEPYSAAVALGNNDLLALVNRAVREFKASGRWEASASELAKELTLAQPPSRVDSLQEKHGPESDKLDSIFNDGILHRIRQRGKLKVAVKEDIPGLGLRDPVTGQWSGLEIDLAREVAQQIFGDRDRVEFYPASVEPSIGLLDLALRWINPLLKNISILSSILFASWWQLGMAGRLPEFLCPVECQDQQDLIGLDYYWGTRAFSFHRISQLVNAIDGRFNLCPVWPGALYGLLHYYAQMMPGLPLLIVENGSVDLADNIRREEYISRHIAQVQRAVQDGLNVIGYMYWSITTNREWGNPLSPSCDFGLYQIDLDHDNSLTRHETRAAKVYRQIIMDRGVGPNYIP